MHDTVASQEKYYGLRMSADEFLALPYDGTWYELVNGVVCMSPSPSFTDQRVLSQIAANIGSCLKDESVGRAVHQVDVRLSDNLVYRPDIVFLSTEKAARCGDKVTEVPDLIVEIISPDSRSIDSQTKKGDYEAAGVREYWLIDPIRKSYCFYKLQNGRYQEMPTSAEKFLSEVLPQFQLDLPSIRKLF